MARIRIPLARSFGNGRSGAAGMQSLVNMYGEVIEGEARTDLACYGTPGRALFSEIGGAPRGQINAAGTHYAVMGTRFYSIGADGTEADIGEIEGSALVDMSYNGNQIDIVADLKTYSYDVPTTTLGEIIDGAFEQANGCTSLASYSLYAVKNSGRFRWRLTNATAFVGTHFATAEAEADNLVAIRRVGNEAALLGSTSVEWWYPTGLSGADAFSKTSTAAVGVGCDFRDTAIVVDDGLMWVGRDGRAGGRSVYRADGYRPRKVSPPEIDAYLEAAPADAPIHALAYQQLGHLNYVLTYPGEWSFTWSITRNEAGEARTQWAWRKSGSWTMGADPTGGWDAVTFAINGDKQIVGSSDGNLYELAPNLYTEDGEGIVREIACPQLSHNGRRAFMSRLELDLETGVGLASGQGSAPVAFASWSDDGGKTWSTPRSASIGPTGQYRYRCYWHGCGSYRNRIIKFRVSDPVKVAVMGAWADVSVGAH